MNKNRDLQLNLSCDFNYSFHSQGWASQRHYPFTQDKRKKVCLVHHSCLPLPVIMHVQTKLGTKDTLGTIVNRML